MRTLVDIADAQIRALDELAQSQKQSRAALIRQAVDDYLAKHQSVSLEKAFGLWGDRKVDGLDYERKLRDEW